MGTEKYQKPKKAPEHQLQPEDVDSMLLGDDAEAAAKKARKALQGGAMRLTRAPVPEKKDTMAESYVLPRKGKLAPVLCEMPLGTDLVGALHKMDPANIPDPEEAMPRKDKLLTALTVFIRKNGMNPDAPVEKNQLLMVTLEDTTARFDLKSVRESRTLLGS